MAIYDYLAQPFVVANVFIFGLIVGSFLNVCIARWPAEQSVIHPRSHCPQCKNLIAWFDNIPVVSWLLLGAKCRHCTQKISWIYPGVELLTACLFLLMWKSLLFILPQADSSVSLTPVQVLAVLVTGIFLMAISIVVFFVDVKHTEIPDEISLNMMPLGPIVCMFFPGVMAQSLYFKMHGWNQVSGNLYCEDWLTALMMSLGGVLVGGGLLYGLTILGEKLLKKEVMGFGDIKLLAMLGGFLGIEGVILTLVLASFLGSIYGIGAKLVTGESRLPFGPWLVIAALVTYVAKFEALTYLLKGISSLDAFWRNTAFLY